MKEIYQQTVEEVLDHVESRESGLKMCNIIVKIHKNRMQIFR